MAMYEVASTYLEIIAATFELIGTVAVAFAALRVHHRFLNEHKVDNNVFKAMRRERIVGVVGVALIILGYLLNIHAQLLRF